MTRMEQLNYWLAGIPKHNGFTGECCPDFSCCFGNNLLADLNERIAYVNAINNARYDILHYMSENFYLKQLINEGFIYVPVKIDA